jgi:hypothetical protein
VAVAAMARLALRAPRGATRDGAHLASARLPPLLDVEEPTGHGTTGRASRCPRLDSRDVEREATLGRPSFMARSRSWESR